MRSAEPYQVWDDDTLVSSDDEDDDPHHKNTPDSFTSTASTSYHIHNHNYVTTSNPINPNIYTFFRKLVLRTLTGEELPRGLTQGKFAFDDSADRTMAVYRFKLYDPMARGKYRQYALIALVGNSNSGAFKAVAHIWERFEAIAAWITRKVGAANEKLEQAENLRNEGEEYIPLSFLTQKARGVKMRGLTEMTDDPKFFAALHVKFIGVLKELREKCG